MHQTGRQDGAQSQFEQFGEEKNLARLRGIEPQTIQSIP